MLAVLLALMLPANMVMVNATGPVFYDGEPIAYITLNGTRAGVEIPKLPGEHIVKVNGIEHTVNLYDVECTSEGEFACNFTGHADLDMNYVLECGDTREGRLVLSDGITERIAADGECDKAFLKVGDYRKEIPFTRVFTNYVQFEGERNVTVVEGDKVILEKFGSGYVGFPELDPGEYWVSAGDLQGKLVVKPIRTAVYGYALSAVLVMATIALLWMG